MAMPVRSLPVVQNWDCSGCSACCRTYHVPVSADERKRIEGQGWEQDAELKETTYIVKEGGWFSTTGSDPSVLLRLKEDYDGAEPAASSVATINALTFAHLTGDDVARDRAIRTLQRYGPRIGNAAARTENVPSLRLLKQVVSEAAGEKKPEALHSHPPNPELSEQLFSRVWYVEDFSRRERSWAPVSAADYRSQMAP